MKKESLTKSQKSVIIKDSHCASGLRTCHNFIQMGIYSLTSIELSPLSICLQVSRPDTQAAPGSTVCPKVCIVLHYISKYLIHKSSIVRYMLWRARQICNICKFAAYSMGEQLHMNYKCFRAFCQVKYALRETGEYFEIFMHILVFTSVMRIRDVYLGSRIRIFSIPDPGSASKNLSILTPWS
jgi:hypothetical protein